MTDEHGRLSDGGATQERLTRALALLTEACAARQAARVIGDDRTSMDLSAVIDILRRLTCRLADTSEHPADPRCCQRGGLGCPGCPILADRVRANNQGPAGQEEA